MDDEQTTLTIEEKEFSLDDYLQVMSDEAKNGLESSFLITPLFNWRDDEGVIYPKESPDFFKFAKQENTIPVVYMSTPEKMLSLNSIDAYLPLITVAVQTIQTIGLDIFIEFVKSYLKMKYSRIFSDDKNSVKFQLKILKTDKKTSLDLSYSGSANNISKTFTPEKISEIMKKL